MAITSSTTGVMKAGIIVAAIIIVVRIILELLGAPEAINNIFGVAWLYFIIPVLFAFGIVSGGETSPYKALLKNIVLFGIYTRLMILVTYLAAYQFRWQAPRFGGGQGGNVAPNIGPLQGLLIIPLRNAAVWVVFVALIGMIIGGIAIFFKKKSTPAAA